MRRDAWYPGLVSVLRAVCCWCSLFWIFTLTEVGVPQSIYVVPFLVYAALCFGFFAWFLRRPREIPVLTTAGGVLWLAGSVVLLWKFSDLTGFTAIAFGAFSVLTVVLISARNCLEPQPAAKSISALEVTTMFLVFFLWMQSVNKLDGSYCLPLLAACLLSASVVIYQRLASVGGSDRGRMRGLVVVVVMLAVIALLMVLFTLYGAGPLGQGAVMLFYGMLYCLKIFWRALEAVLIWLASLLPEVGGELQADPLPELAMPEGTLEEPDLPPWILAVLGIIGICAVAALLVYVLFRLRKVRIGGKTAAWVEVRAERKKLPLGLWLRRVLTALKNKLFLLWAMVTMRGSPQELYLYLKRAGRRLNCSQQPGETPCAFVRRAARVTADGAEPDLPRALEDLAVALGICLYAPEMPEPLPKETVQCIRRGYRKALQKARREQLRHWFAEKLSEKKEKTAEPS